MNLNRPTYEALPYAYIAAGVLSAALVDSSLRLLPAFLLICAGALVFAWRHSARLKAERVGRRRLASGARLKSL